MCDVKKEVVLDKQRRPVAVQIKYADWLVIEEQVDAQQLHTPQVADLSRHAGTLMLREDPIAYQGKVRDEWQ